MKRAIKKAIKKIESDIKASTRDNLYSRGLSREGYSGGYVDALYDVLLLANKVRPNRRNWWD